MSYVPYLHARGIRVGSCLFHASAFRAGAECSHPTRARNSILHAAHTKFFSRSARACGEVVRGVRELATLHTTNMHGKNASFKKNIDNYMRAISFPLRVTSDPNGT